LIQNECEIRSSMEIGEVYPSTAQHLYCDECGGGLYLAYTDFDEVVSEIAVRISGLPVLRCDHCKEDALPDHSRFAIITLWEQAKERDTKGVHSTRKKPPIKFNQTDLPFQYDTDDYRYLPGLERPDDDGFLTPVFFDKEVLLKYDVSPSYSVRFASTTYGTVFGDGFYISFGLNKNGRVIMWLGDIASLPSKEQYYLLSHNIPSDHDICGEFYDGQIEAKFTERSREDALFALRSDFIVAASARWGQRIAHLDSEVLDLLPDCRPPLVDTNVERRRLADALNKIYIESFDNKNLATILKDAGVTAEGSGTLKRLQAALLMIESDADAIRSILSPFFTLYDFRVACLHLTSADTADKTLKTVTERLGLPDSASIAEIYDQLIGRLTAAFQKMIAIVAD
jgi:hypothetical protein